MRPIYEGSGDLDNERTVITKLCEEWDMEAAKLPITYNVDYGLFKDSKLRAWVEVKCRSCGIDQYDTYFISAKKILNGVFLSQNTGSPFILAVQWTDALGYINIKSDTKFDIRIGGRRDRNDWQDVEPMAHFSTRDFNILIQDSE